jgi:thioredoxin-dependent peroxiredoxin
MVKLGEPAPPFDGTTGAGEPFSLASTRGRPVVLYFYPKAGTMGCTREAEEFTRAYPEFVRGGTALIGVSVDTVEAQRRFAEHCNIPFPLIADSSKEIARAYGVLGRLGLSRRVTFFIGADGRVEEIVEGLLPGPHVRCAVERLRAAPPPPDAAAAAGPRPGGTP